MPDRNGSHQHASLPPSSLGFFTWKAGGDRTDGMRWMMLRYADMICSAVWFRKSSCCDPSATIGLWPIVATKSAMQQKALPSSTSIRQSSQNTLGHLHLQCFRNLTSEDRKNLPGTQTCDVGHCWMMFDSASLCSLCHARCWGCSSDALLWQPSYAKNVRPKHLISSRNLTWFTVRQRKELQICQLRPNWSHCQQSPVLRLQSLACLQFNTLIR